MFHPKQVIICSYFVLNLIHCSFSHMIWDGSYGAGKDPGLRVGRHGVDMCENMKPGSHSMSKPLVEGLEATDTS